MITGKTQLYGIFGHPVEHTFSPAMHNAAFRELRRNACYLPFPVRPEDLGSAVRAARALGLRGLNITVPHKEKVIRYLDDLSQEARLIGAVNTVEMRGAKLIGHNTDGRGFLRSLRENAGFDPRKQSVLCIGSGGAARAVGFSLALAGVRTFSVHDIDVRKARALARDIRRKTGADADAVQAEDVPAVAAASDCLINATPLGLRPGDPLPIRKQDIQKRHLVCDLVYNPPLTPLLKAARDRGAKRLPGIGMLLFQGVIAFEIWTGVQAPIAVMQRALAREIAKRRMH